MYFHFQHITHFKFYGRIFKSSSNFQSQLQFKSHHAHIQIKQFQCNNKPAKIKAKSYAIINTKYIIQYKKINNLKKYILNLGKKVNVPCLQENMPFTVFHASFWKRHPTSFYLLWSDNNSSNIFIIPYFGKYSK